MIKLHPCRESDNPWVILLDNALRHYLGHLKRREPSFHLFPTFGFFSCAHKLSPGSILDSEEGGLMSSLVS